MKIISLLIIFLFLFFSFCNADQLEIPFSCYPKLLQKEFARNKLKLDLDPAKRDKKSWGYLKNEGAGYKIYTYKSITKEELGVVLKIVRDIEKKQNPSKGDKIQKKQKTKGN